jgi:predicted DNA-binding protein (MmcQ/YjbR family)
MARRSRSTTSTVAALRSFTFDLPGAVEDHPWDSAPVAKVNKKIFVFFGHDDEPGMSVKLPESAEAALTLACATPTGYGLGRSGWVSVDFRGADCPPDDVLIDWIEESYRAVALKKLVKELDARLAEG